ncbi:uncharacterized protein [Narcine bancroftii]|uniref:uncharacterized protein n=1 Tax=Narcine bancroftii TaxID=1343680 RepID=UPI003831DDF3
MQEVTAEIRGMLWAIVSDDLQHDCLHQERQAEQEERIVCCYLEMERQEREADRRERQRIKDSFARMISNIHQEMQAPTGLMMVLISMLSAPAGLQPPSSSLQPPPSSRLPTPSAHLPPLSSLLFPPASSLHHQPSFLHHLLISLHSQHTVFHNLPSFLHHLPGSMDHLIYDPAPIAPNYSTLAEGDDSFNSPLTSPLLLLLEKEI